MTTIKQELLALGMKENELDTHESDLYALKNDISEKWLQGYEFKNNVTTFTSEIDNKVWYDIPFGYMSEHYVKRFDI